MALNIKTLDGEHKNTVFGLLAGKAGVGKTTQATTFPREETFIVSVENGLLSIAGSGYAAEEIDTYDRLIEIICNEAEKAGWIKYMIIDSLSEIYDLINREAKHKYKPSQNFAKFDEVKDKMFYAIRTAKNLKNITTWFICHTKEDKDGLALVENLKFDGKLPEDIKAQFDLCVVLRDVALDDGTFTKTLVTSPALSKCAKKRVSPWLNITLEDQEEPNLYKLTNKLLGKGN